MPTSPPRTRHIDIVFDREPGPVCPGFIEIELDTGRSVMLGRWIKRPDGTHAIRITRADIEHWMDSYVVPAGPGASWLMPAPKYGRRS